MGKHAEPSMVFETGDMTFELYAAKGRVAWVDIDADGELWMSEVVQLRDALSQMIEIVEKARTYADQTAPGACGIPSWR